MSVTNIAIKNTTNINVDRNTYVYVLNITTETFGNTYIYTLPEIICNGEHYSFSRIDNSDNIFNIVAATGDLICESTSDTGTSINILQKRSVELISLNACWYILYNTSTSNGNQIKFCVSYQGNNQENFIPFSTAIMYYMPFAGTDNGDNIDEVIILTEDLPINSYSMTKNGAVVIWDETPPTSTTIINGKKVFRHILAANEKNFLPLDNNETIQLRIEVPNPTEVYANLVY